MYISTHGWSNEKIETQFARDGGIATVDVLLNTGVVIRWWHANRKWLLCDVCDKSCSNTRHATILTFNHMLHCHVRRKYAVVVKLALVFSSSVVLVISSSSDTVGRVCLHLTTVCKEWYQAFIWVLIDLIIGFLGLIIKAFDNQTEIWGWLSSPLIIKRFEILDDNHDYFVYKTFTHKSNKPD